MFGRLVCLCTALLCALVSHADNGAVARAGIANNIVIDGDTSEWPADLPRYFVSMDGNGDAVAPDNKFSASFRTAYDAGENMLYIALEIIDDVHVVANDIDSDDWDSFDSVIAYVDFNHTTSGSGAAMFLVTGDHRAMLSDERSWDADVASTRLDALEAAVVRTGDTTVYEWRISSHRPLAPDATLGLDFLIADRDAQDENSNSRLFSWGAGFGKSQAGGRTGDLLLMGEETRSGELVGSIMLADPEPDADARQLRVRVQSKDDSRLWVQATASDSGHYAVKLPVGRYDVTSVDRIAWKDDVAQVVAPAKAVTVIVKADAETVAPDIRLVTKRRPLALQETGVLFDFNKEDAQSLDGVVESLMVHYQVPGVSLALVKDGALAYHATYGIQNAYSKEPVGQKTLFEAASITKTVFAFAVNRMAERGDIDLDRPLHTYLAFEDIAHDKRYEKITARHVLSHQSGLPNWRWMNDDGQLDIKFYPGIQYGYSGEGFEYLGRVVAHITGEPLEDVVRRETLSVMGFEENTFFAERPELYSQVSRGHLAGKTGPHSFSNEIGVAHSMLTEARTFSTFMTSLLAGKGLSTAGYANMLEPQVAIPADPNDNPAWPRRFGLGFELMNSPFGLAYGHGGNNGNFTCRFELYPEHRMGWVVFTNADTGYLLAEALREYLVMGDSQKIARTEAF